jgi:hypothetical protein
VKSEAKIKDQVIDLHEGTKVYVKKKVEGRWKSATY